MSVELMRSQGVQLLAYWRLASTEQEHARQIMQLLDLPEGALVVDLGCGTGQLARLCHALRPDLAWTLVNTDSMQLTQCPEWAAWVMEDMAETSLPSASFDAVVIEYALGYCNPAKALGEASRLLRPGGALLLHELFARGHEGQSRAASELRYRVASFSETTLWAQLQALDLEAVRHDDHRAPGAIVADAAPLFEHLDHRVALFRRATRAPKFEGRRAALHFSGGKDSLACLYMLRPFVELGLPVYWANTGDGIPETGAVVSAVRAWVPRFIEVRSDVRAWTAQNGAPSDVTTAQTSWLGAQYGMGELRLTGRFECCYHNIMRPMHERMLADGIDLVVRGTKLADTGKVPAVGPTEHYEVMLPLLEASHAEVFDYLRQVGAPTNAVYDHFKSISAPECLHCTAWWDDGKAAYLKALHTDKVGQYRVGLNTIRDELQRRMRELDGELAELNKED